MTVWKRARHRARRRVPDLPDVVLVVEHPAAPLVDALHWQHVRSMSLMLGAVLLSAVAGASMSRILVRPIVSLSNATAGVAQAVERRERVELPRSRLRELEHLASNFHAMMRSLDGNFEELTRVATRDPVTRLFNRSKMDAILEEEHTRANRYGRGFSIILVDIDGFKKINDGFGHAVGDDALREIAHRMKTSVRQTDMLGRWGGDEFLIVLPETNRADATAVAEKLRHAVASTAFEPVGTLTISLGVAEHAPGRDADDPLAAADSALYRAKEKGRDRVEV